MANVPVSPLCPKCGGPGGVRMLLSVAPCERCAADGKNVAPQANVVLAAAQATPLPFSPPADERNLSALIAFADRLSKHQTRGCVRRELADQFDVRGRLADQILESVYGAPAPNRNTFLDAVRFAAGYDLSIEKIGPEVAKMSGSMFFDQGVVDTHLSLYDRVEQIGNTGWQRRRAWDAPRILILDDQVHFEGGRLKDPSCVDGYDRVHVTVSPMLATNSKLEVRPSPKRIMDTAFALYDLGFMSLKIDTHAILVGYANYIAQIMASRRFDNTVI